MRSLLSSPLPFSLSALLVLAAMGCGEDRPPPPCLTGCDAGPRCDDIYDPPPSTGDADGDGTPDDRDDDADGDGVPNTFENIGGHSCAPPDPDGDGIDNWLDVDSDNDGLRDGTEFESPSDPYDADTDDDGATDLIEMLGAQTSPTNPESRPRDSDVAVLVPHMGGDVTVLARLANRVENADVFFLVDTTGSMREERTNLIESLTDVIIPALTTAFSDVHYGAAGFDDYPVGGFGGGDDLPFYLLTPMMPGLRDEARWSNGSGCPLTVGRLTGSANGEPDIVDAVGGLACHNGSDWPESFVPALYATATGAGLSWPGGSVAPQTSCPEGTVGYPCFRPYALPVILLVGDASFHNGPRAEFDYGSAVPDAPTWDETTQALGDIGARVISIYSGGGDDLMDYEALALETGARGVDGAALVFPIEPDGSGLDTTIIDALRVLAGGSLQDITLAVENGAGNPPSVDALTLVSRVVAHEGYAPDGTPGENDGVSYAGKSETQFFNVMPGAEVEFQLTLRNDTVPATDDAQVFTLLLRGIGNGGAAFATRNVYMVVTQDGAVVEL